MKTLSYFFAAIFIMCHIAAPAQNAELRNLKFQLAGTKDSLAYLQLLNKIGFLIHMESADSSFAYGIRANRLADKLYARRGKADAMANIATGLTLKGLYSQALDNYSKAYEQYSGIPDTMEMAQMLMNSAITYSFTGDSAQMKEFAQRALQMAACLKADSGLSMLYANYVDLGCTAADSLVIYLARAKKIADHFHDDRALLFILQVKAETAIANKDYKAARGLVQHSLEIAAAHGWDYHTMEGLNIYGELYMAEDLPDSALSAYLRIRRMAQMNHYVFWQTDVLRSILKAYELKKDTANQLRVSRDLVTALDTAQSAAQSFFGDYIRFNESKEKVTELKHLNRVMVTAGLALILSVLAIFYAFARTRQQRQQLEVLNKELRERDEFNQKLLALLAHDFRAPLGQALGMLVLFRDEEVDREVQLRFCDKLESDIGGVLNTFDNILEWIKKQVTGYQPGLEELNLYTLLEESGSMFRQLIENKCLILNNLVDPTQTIRSDPQMLQFINRNLVHNAVKYSPVNGIITMMMKHKPGELVVCIRNEGAGIAPDELERLFTFRKTAATDRGAGMALTLSKEFILLLGGRIWAESVPGDGAYFYYALPQPG